MANSLADQLLKSGLIDAKKANQAKKEKKKQQKQQFKSKEVAPDETKLAAQRALAEKQNKSRELNQQRELQLQAAAISAQIKQLIANNIIMHEGDIGFNFVDAGKVKKIYINSKIQDDLNKGRLAIVKFGKSYELVPAKIAEKIAQRDASYVLLVNNKTELVDESDPYADYPIPDDLMW